VENGWELAQGMVWFRAGKSLMECYFKGKYMRIWRRICLRITRKLLETGSGIAWEVFREGNRWRDDSECGGDREEIGGELAGERSGRRSLRELEG